MAMQSPPHFFDEIEKFLYDVFDAGLNKNAVLHRLIHSGNNIQA